MTLTRAGGGRRDGEEGREKDSFRSFNLDHYSLKQQTTDYLFRRGSGQGNPIFIPYFKSSNSLAEKKLVKYPFTGQDHSHYLILDPDLPSSSRAGRHLR